MRNPVSPKLLGILSITMLLTSQLGLAASPLAAGRYVSTQDNCEILVTESQGRVGFRINAIGNQDFRKMISYGVEESSVEVSANGQVSVSESADGASFLLSGQVVGDDHELNWIDARTRFFGLPFSGLHYVCRGLKRQ